MLDFVYTKSPVIAECNNKVITRKKYKKIIVDDLFGDILTDENIKYLSQFKKIRFGKSFDKSIENLPEGVDEIEFVDFFDQSIIKLPETIRYLYLGMKIYKNTFNFESDKLVMLTIKPKNFNQKINYYSNLVYLQIGRAHV